MRIRRHAEVGRRERRMGMAGFRQPGRPNDLPEMARRRPPLGRAPSRLRPGAPPDIRPGVPGLVPAQRRIRVARPLELAAHRHAAARDLAWVSVPRLEEHDRRTADPGGRAIDRRRPTGPGRAACGGRKDRPGASRGRARLVLPQGRQPPLDAPGLAGPGPRICAAAVRPPAGPEFPERHDRTDRLAAPRRRPHQGPGAGWAADASPARQMTASPPCRSRTDRRARRAAQPIAISRSAGRLATTIACSPRNTFASGGCS